jgi:hypothetical protein
MVSELSVTRSVRQVDDHHATSKRQIDSFGSLEDRISGRGGRVAEGGGLLKQPALFVLITFHLY